LQESDSERPEHTTASSVFQRYRGGVQRLACS
jgi:hypothetical protein